MLYIERPKAARELVIALPLRVAEGTLQGLTLANDD